MPKRVYELAKELKLSSREVIAALAGLGVVAKSHSSTVEADVVAKLVEGAEKGTLKQLAATAVVVRPQRPKRPSHPPAERTAERPSAERTATGPTPATRATAAKKRPDVAVESTAKSEPTAVPAAVESPAAELAAPDAQAPVADKILSIHRGITVSELASMIGVSPTEIIKKLFLLGEAYTVAQSLSDDAAELMCSEHGFTAKIVSPLEQVEAEDSSEDEDVSMLVPRPPVITVMGHVDHGKTLLLDRIRKTDVVAQEHGGITQHIGAYQVHKNDRAITFIDTPGHEAFTQMRARGAKATDIAVLVVAADDGVKPQTVEALAHARAAEVPIVVAVNKIDKPEADPGRVRQQLTEHGLVPEEWGGDTPFVDVSAKSGDKIEDLLDVLLLVADIAELKANPDAPPRGVVIEAHLDKGRGPVATVLVQRGTLQAGDVIVCGASWARVRAMLDDGGTPVKEAGPGTPIQVLGFSTVPQAGDDFRSADSERAARQIAQDRETKRRAAEHVAGRRRVTLEDLYAEARDGEALELTVVLKADVQGSLEAVTDALEKLQVEDASVRVLHRAVGAISENDITLAEASGAVVLGFNVRPDPKARALAEQGGVDIKTYQIIYKLVEEVEAALKGMLRPIFAEEVMGRAQVRETFKVPKVGIIAGSYVEEGVIKRGAKVRLLREGVILADTTVSSLRRFKEDVREVAGGYECGIGMDNYQDIKEGDVFESYEVREVPR
ncbi:MAG: translation initiation factor IF-2 [Actinomycetota bacterium]